MKEFESIKWINHYGWNNIKEKYPEPNSEVVVFYRHSSDEGTCYNVSEVINEKFITDIDSPILYWINKPE